jgi:hypothetical protein
MKRPALRCIAHSVARKLFEAHPTGSVEGAAINSALIAACADPRNSDMTQQQFQQATGLFIPRELGRLARRAVKGIIT